MKKRLDVLLVKKGLAPSRAQAAAYIMSGRVKVDGKTADKAGHSYDEQSPLSLESAARYVSRGALKLESVAQKLELDFTGKVVLDVGSSTGGFTDYALQHGSVKVYAVDVGTGQLDNRLREDARVVAMEKTDIRSVNELPEKADMAVIDVSFISLKLVLPPVAKLIKKDGYIVAMVKPQFEADRKTASMHKGVIKNDTIRRRILKDFEEWSASKFLLVKKADSEIAGAKGNIERFYLLKLR